MDEWASVPLSVHHRSRVFGQSLQLLHLVHQSLEAHPLHPAKTTLASTWQEPLKRVNIEKHNLHQKRDPQLGASEIGPDAPDLGAGCQPEPPPQKPPPSPPHPWSKKYSRWSIWGGGGWGVGGIYKLLVFPLNAPYGGSGRNSARRYERSWRHFLYQTCTEE